MEHGLLPYRQSRPQDLPTLKEWYAYKWRDHIKDAKYRLDIRFQMRRHGDQVGPAVEGDKMN